MINQLKRLTMVARKHAGRIRHQVPGLNQLLLVGVLADEGDQEINELAKWIGVSTASITGLVDSLANAGLVERQMVKDRRVRRVVLTDAGRVFAAELREVLG